MMPANADNIAVILLVGKVLSVLAVVLLVVAFINLWRRESLPEVSYGGLTLSTRRLKWLWFTLLLGSLAMVGSGDLGAIRSQTLEDLENEAGELRTGEKRSTELSVPLPFYRYERSREFRGGHLVEETVTEGVLVPWPFLGTLIAYLVLVVRWNPENRWALRILHGRKRKA